MMIYTFEVVETDASSTISQWPGEDESDFLKRAAIAKGNHFFSINVISFRNGNAKQKHYESPYFKEGDDEKRAEIFQEVLSRTGEAILKHEATLPEIELPPEEPIIVLPPGFGQ